MKKIVEEEKIIKNIKSKKLKISPIPEFLYLPKLVNNSSSF